MPHFIGRSCMRSGGDPILCDGRELESREGFCLLALIELEILGGYNETKKQLRINLPIATRAVVVAQLGERSLPTPEVRGSIPVFVKLLYRTCVDCQLY